MASILSIVIACILWGVSLFLPVKDGMTGFQVIIVALIMHVFILPFFWVFPVWANFTFFRAVWYYSQSSKEKFYNDRKAKEWAAFTFILMIFGILIHILMAKAFELNIGSIIWLSSSVFLLCGIYLHSYKEIYAILCLSCLILVFFLEGFYLCKKELNDYQYQDEQYKKFTLERKLFQGKESDLKIPILTQVKQNNLKRLENKVKLDKTVKNLEFSKNDIIEIQFNTIIPNFEQSAEKLKCELEVGQQFSLPLPPQYIERNIFWKNYHDFAIGMPTKLESNYIYKVRSIDKRHTQIEIIQKNNKKTIYEQTLVTYAQKIYADYHRCVYGPIGYVDELSAAFKADYLPKELNNSSLESDGKFKHKETLMTRCTWKTSTKKVYSFEDKFFKTLDQKVLKSKLFCSEHYVAVVNFVKNKYEAVDDFLEVQFLRRATLQPIECGWLLFYLEKEQIKDLYESKLLIQKFDILDSSISRTCPEIKLTLSDGFTNIDRSLH